MNQNTNSIYIFSILPILLLFLNGKVAAQDIIYKTDGNEIKAKVVEIDDNFIKYKNFGQIEGPLRNILKSQVFMIKYQDGTEEKFSVITEQKNDTIKNQRPKLTSGFTSDYIDLQMQKALSTRKAGDILYGISSISCLVGLILINTKNEAIAIPFAVLCGTTFFTALSLDLSGKSKYKYWSKKKAELSLFIKPLYQNNINLNLNNYCRQFEIGLMVTF